LPRDVVYSHKPVYTHEIFVDYEKTAKHFVDFLSNILVSHARSGTELVTIINFIYWSCGSLLLLSYFNQRIFNPL